jgi:hypothetical protein
MHSAAALPSLVFLRRSRSKAKLGGDRLSRAGLNFDALRDYLKLSFACGRSVV